MPKDHDDLSLPAGPAAPTAADFDRAFSAAAVSPGVRRVWELAAPELPPQIEPFSFVSADLLRHVAQALDLSPGQTLVDLGCGRGGPGLWLARETNASLIGVDFSPVAVDQAAHRAALFGLADRARFAVGDVTRTGLPQASADAVVSIDAFHFAADPAAAAGEARRILRPGRRLVLTNWQPKDPNDPRLPDRMRINWPQLLRSAGFADIEMAARPEWHDLWTRVYRVALDLGDPSGDVLLADLQDEARHRLPVANLIHRVAVTATAPDRPRPAPPKYATLGLRIRSSCAKLKLRISAKEAERRGNMAVSNNVSDTIERDILIAAPAEKVWEVVSIPGWWINEGSALELSLIERITEDRALVHHPKHGDFLVERLDVDPPRAVSFRWLVSGAEGPRIDVAEDQLLHTRVTLTLTPEPGGTLLSVVESGFAAAAVDEDVRRRAYEGNSEGWKIELDVVRAYVESA